MTYVPDLLFTFPAHAEPTHGSGLYEGDHNPKLRRQKQEDVQFKASLGNLSSENMRPLLTSPKPHQLEGSVAVANQGCFP